MTDPHPVGNPVAAFRQTLARCKRVEAENRRLKARLADLTGQERE